MRALKRHLETVSSEGLELASKWLGCNDWSLRDMLTWLVFVIQYLVINGYTNGPEWKGSYDEIFTREYYLLNVSRKLIILQILCEQATAFRAVKPLLLEPFAPSREFHHELLLVLARNRDLFVAAPLLHHSLRESLLLLSFAHLVFVKAIPLRTRMALSHGTWITVLCRKPRLVALGC